VIPFVLGLMGHMRNSTVIALACRGRPNPAVTAMGGVVYWPVVNASCTWVLLRSIFTISLAPGVQSFPLLGPEVGVDRRSLIFGLVLSGLLAYGPDRLAAGGTGRPVAG